MNEGGKSYVTREKNSLKYTVKSVLFLLFPRIAKPVNKILFNAVIFLLHFLAKNFLNIN